MAEITTGAFGGTDTNKTTIEELASDFLRDYKINGLKSFDDAERRWLRHLKPHFGIYKASQVTSELVARYIDARQQSGAESSTINRELSCLRRMYSLGMSATPPRVLRVPKIPQLAERNVRTGFLESGECDRLAGETAKIGLWLRAMFEVGCTCGWRVSELLELRVKQVDLISRTIRLNVGETKNGDGRIAVMTDTTHVLVSTCVRGKGDDDHVFTRPNGKPVRDFRVNWHKACCAAKVGKMVCPSCKSVIVVDGENHCSQCSARVEDQGVTVCWSDFSRPAPKRRAHNGSIWRSGAGCHGHFRTQDAFGV